MSYNCGKNNPMFGKKPWNKGSKGIMKSWNKGLFLSKKIRKKMSESHKGLKHSEETKRKIQISQLKYLKKHKHSWLGRKQTDEHRKKISQSHMGDKNPFWKGGITPIRILIRTSLEDKEWIKKVFKRDNYTCQECFKQGRGLEAHHKKEFAKILQEFLQQYSQFSPIEDKETLIRLAITYAPFWDIDNGITLCKDCHNLTKQEQNNVRMAEPAA